MVTELRENISSDYTHLDPRVISVVNKDISERIDFIWSDRWIGYPKAIGAVKELEKLFKIPKRQRMPNLLILGPTNNGKSMLLNYFCRRHPPILHDKNVRDFVSLSGYKEVPVALMQMPPYPDTRRFYSVLLDYLGVEVRATTRNSTLEVLAMNEMKKKKVRMLMIDELHNLLAGRQPQQQEFLNIIRFLGNDLQIPIVGVGTRDAYMAISSDIQLENRFIPFYLSPWAEDEDYYALLASFARVLPLKKPSQLQEKSIANYIFNETGGILGEIAMLLCMAAEKAVYSGAEHINDTVLQLTKYQSPALRRKEMERSMA